MESNGARPSLQAKSSQSARPGPKTRRQGRPGSRSQLTVPHERLGKTLPKYHDATGNLKEQQNTKEFRIDEATKQDLSTRIGEAMAGHVVNNFYSQLSSNPSIDARIRGKPLGWLEDNYPLTGAKLQSRHGR